MSSALPHVPILLQIALGGAIGAAARHLLGLAVLRVTGPGFPLGMLTVNVAGSFAMGVAAVLLAQRGASWAPFAMTGVLGGFTTFSAFSLEAVSLLEKGLLGQAAAYVTLSVGASMGALFLGLLLARGIVA
ncbi:fluoride efflux transporter CrcB [Profundibacterium mesophilum]|uniref:Fluoride-specific ion channel FluC n=1 Tax=Profundibacterium mesophilum KAUST100406-0324 TaxID=1037889 RepID=A0A921NT96_9RHOB|nr:fluoride efflux transporter CrcB [Profundibacterium mesophilum]KAF0676189.1 Protein CrcB like protein [Profundibacterium mesophilum KAUST100406-0324]